MKSIKYILFVNLILTCFITFAQIDNQIINYVDSTEVIIDNGRNVIWQSLKTADYQKANQAFTYISLKTSNLNCNALNYNELLYFACITGQWQLWVSTALNYNQYNPTCYQFDTGFENYLYTEVIRKYDSIINHLQNAGIDAEDKAIIDVFLALVKNVNDETEYLKRKKAFRDSYKTSKYDSFFNTYLPAKSSKQSYAVAIGPSIIKTTNNLSGIFNAKPGFYISCDYKLNNIYISLYNSSTTLELYEQIYVTTKTERVDFKIGDKFKYNEFGFNLGYLLNRGNYFHIAPYLTLGHCYLISDIYDEADDKDEIGAFKSFIYGPGLHTELKIASTKPAPNATPGVYYPTYYFSVKFEAGYNIVAKNEIDLFKGNFPYIRAAFVIGSGMF